MATEISDLKREFRKELSELKNSMDFINKEFEALKKECSKVKNENVALKETQQVLAQEIEALKRKVQKNAMKVVAEDQYSRNKNIAVKGIPQEMYESLIGVLGKVGDVLGETIRKEDVEACHRIPARNSDSDPNIVVVFHSRTKRNVFLNKARKHRLTTSEIGFSANQSVYINEHLCPQLKKLLGMTIAKKKEVNWRFAWAKNGKIFARQKHHLSCVFPVSQTWKTCNVPPL